MPTNPYYQEAFSAVVGSMARSRAMDNEFQAIQYAFDLLTAAVNEIEATVVQRLTDLDDAPGSYAGNALKWLRVNAAASGIEFVAGGTFGIKVIGGTEYTVLAADAGYLLLFTNSADIVVTVPANATEAIDAGTSVMLGQYGVGRVTVVPESGVSIRSSDELLSTRTQYAQIALGKVDTDEWTLIGERNAPSLENGIDAATDVDTTGKADGDVLTWDLAQAKWVPQAPSTINDAMVFRGVIDCSANPNYPAGDRGDTYRVSVAGKIGGAAGPNVEVGDLLVCLTDGTATGDHAAVGAQWGAVQSNIDGAVIGPSSSTDNTLTRFDGATGKLVQGSGVALTDNDELSGYRGHVNRQTGTTYTLVAADCGKIVECANAAAIAVTLPNDLPQGFNCTVVQDGAGQITFTAAGGGSLKNRQSHTKSAGNGAFCALYVSSNSATDAAWRLGGDTAA